MIYQLDASQKNDSITFIASLHSQKSSQYNWMPYVYIVQWPKRSSTAILRTTKDQLNQLLYDPAITFADVLRTPKTEINVALYNMAINNIELVRSKQPLLNGHTEIVSIREDLFDTTDIDLHGKYIRTANTASTLNAHTTIMATLVAGAGNAGPAALGVAPAAQLTSSSFTTLLPDDPQTFRLQKTILQNHSYGVNIENYYGAEAAAYDQMVIEADTFVHVFSSGNIGTTTPTSGQYQGIQGVANLTGTFKQAKNVLVIGGTDGKNVVADLSSKGPAYDGRLKPEIVAYGEDGTSGAAAITSGAITLLQQAYKSKFTQAPPSALLRAIVMSSATDINTPGIDYTSGYGALNLSAALHVLQASQFAKTTLTSNGQYTLPIQVPTNTGQLKVTIAWNDPAAEANSAKALVNDLDMQVISPDSDITLPWVLSTFPLKDSLLKAATRGVNHVDNHEQVSITAPAAGTYHVHIKAPQLAGNSQTVYIAWQFIPKEYFDWEYPTRNTIVTPGQAYTLQWHSDLGGTGNLSYSIDNGQQWQPIALNTPVSQQNMEWVGPANTFTRALLRMETPKGTFTSDTFHISSPTQLQVGFNCTDSVMFYWNSLQGAAQYQLYAIVNDQLQPYRQTADTFIVFATSPNLPTHFAVAPIASNGDIGARSATIQYAQQGVGCYIQQFITDKIENNQVSLTLSLSTLLGIQSITWERRNNNGYDDLGSQQITSSKTYQFIDTNPPGGIVQYRVKITLRDGRIIYSDISSVEVLRGAAMIVFPNPVQQQMEVVTGDIEGEEVLKIIDAQGRVRKLVAHVSARHTLQLGSLPAGVYWCILYRDGKAIGKISFVKL
ncbi:S8 family peptidase [Chitinophaga skermanii]|uniref:S8 family peptidase n=1 Tax=Chitinophaga skermanii TaxID=331697 RepID=UPI001314D291|nr:S8 family peptidase [Chitinophaga skermanii]